MNRYAQVMVWTLAVAGLLGGCTPKPAAPPVKEDAAPAEASPSSQPVNTGTAADGGYVLDGMTVKQQVPERPQRPVDDLIADLDDENWEVRLAAVEDLGRSGDTSDKVIDALVNSYNDRHGAVYFAASDALVRIGTKAVPKVIEGLDFPGENARFAAAYTLKRINPPPVEALQPLLDSLEDEGTYVRMYTVQAIWHLGAAAEPALPMLETIAANENEDNETRAYAAQAIQYIHEKLTEEGNGGG